MNKKLINYSQCWEDSDILREALSINANDCVLSITSGGDNTIALLLDAPHQIISIDLNVAQNYLLELKLAATKSLTYPEYLEFLGAKESKRRIELFEKVRNLLSGDVDDWWSNNRSLIKTGIINCGRFEKFTQWFAKFILPLVHSKKTIFKFTTLGNIEEQVNFYKNKWDTKRWRLFLGLAANRLTLKRFARQRGMFTYSEVGTVAKIYRDRLERNLNSILIKDNYFLHYSLMGKYAQALPSYLQEKEYTLLNRSSNLPLSIETLDLLNYLKSKPDNTFSKFNLSDIFEALSTVENDTLWKEIIRTAKNGAGVVYWNNLVKRSYPDNLSANIKTNNKLENELQAKDKVFFYDSFHVNTIIK